MALQLRSFRCRGLKAFSTAIEIRTPRLTVLFGKNNSGKTTLVRLPLLIREYVSAPSLYQDRIGGPQEYITGRLRDIASKNQAHPSLEYGAQWGDHQSLVVRLQDYSTHAGRSTVRVNRIELNDTIFDFKPVLPREGPYTTPRSNPPPEIDSWPHIDTLQDKREELLQHLQSTVHLPSHRPWAEHVYAHRPPQSWAHSETAYALEEYPELLSGVDDWCRSNLDGLGITVERAGFAFRVVGSRVGQKATVAASYLGRGTLAVLPIAVVAKAVAAELLSSQLLLIEEPEAHLHPAAHGAIADLILPAAKFAQVLVETHSENFILRLRRRVAEGMLNPSDLALYYLDDDHSLQLIPLDRDGSTNVWPVGVFEYDVHEAEAIVQARLNRRDDR